MANISDLLQFVELLNKFSQIRRIICVKDEDRLENDLEHCYRMTMLSWYILELENLDLNRDLVIKYALVHDLVEVYAGDTYIYSTDKELVESKKEREDKAAEQLKEEFPDLTEIHELIKAYEKREDEESKFVYALDKVEPILNIYSDNGRAWQEHDITIDMLIENKSNKVKEFPLVEKYFKEIISILRENEVELFNKKS